MTPEGLEAVVAGALTGTAIILIVLAWRAVKYGVKRIRARFDGE